MLRCERCNGRVGDISCGKSIHATMESKIEAVQQLARELGHDMSRAEAIREVRAEEEATN